MLNDFPKEFIIGRPYHMSWAKRRGMVWILKSFDPVKDEANLITPATRKPLKTKLSALRDVNKQIAKNNSTQAQNRSNSNS